MMLATLLLFQFMSITMLFCAVPLKRNATR